MMQDMIEQRYSWVRWSVVRDVSGMDGFVAEFGRLLLASRYATPQELGELTLHVPRSAVLCSNISFRSRYKITPSVTTLARYDELEPSPLSNHRDGRSSWLAGILCDVFGEEVQEPLVLTGELLGT
jgi:hypothetical protein